MRSKFTKLATALMIAAAAPSFAADGNDAFVTQAQLAESDGAAERVEAAALLRVLSQEAASAACHMAHDINPKEARMLMLEAKNKFHKILDALLQGNPDMGIFGAEHRKKTIVKIETLRSAWAPMYDAALTLLEDPYNTDALNIIKANNEAVLAAATALSTDLAGEYANPAELLQTDLMLIEFSARQAMLTQKMAKISCEIWVGNRSEDRIALLGKTMQMYGLTLQALTGGMPSVGLRPAPTDEIRAALTLAGEAWTKTQAQLNIVLSGDGVTQEVKETLFHNLNVAMYEMEHIEHLYVLHSKHEYTTKTPDKDGDT